MKKNIPLLILLVVCSFGHGIAQRVVEPVFTVGFLRSGSPNFKGAVVDESAFVAVYEGFYEYDGTSYSRHDYPVRDGAPTTISNIFGGTNIDAWHIEEKMQLPVLNSVIYLNLVSQISGGCVFESCPRYLYQFEDRTMVPSPITEETLSNPVVFQNNLYIVVRTDDGASLLRFDGSTVSVVIPALEYNNDDVIALYLTDQYLYLARHQYPVSGSPIDVNVKRFDGSVFIDIPQFDLPLYSWVQEVSQHPGTETVYFISENDITQFDGSGVTEIAEGVSLVYCGFTDFENSFYFTVCEPLSPVLFRYHEGTVETVALPDGSHITGSDAMIVYDGSLFLSAWLPSGRTIIYRYDGTTFNTFLTAEAEEIFSGLSEREGKLIIRAFPESLEYDGRAFCTIASNNFRPRTSLTTTDFSLWWKHERVDRDDYFVYGVERKTGCGGDDDIPDPGYERIDLSLFGAGFDDDYCGLGIRWPPPRPPFPDRWWQVSLTDTKGTKVFEEKFNKPSEFSLPLSAKQSYDLSLKVLNETTQSFENVITIDKELVPLGLSDLSLSMEPKKGKVFLNAVTINGKEVPFQLTLFNQKGIAIWQEIFTAPLTKEITDGIEVGASLRLSAIPGQPMEVKLNYYPNPFAGKITVDLDAQKEAPVYLAIYSLQGELIQQKTLLQAPGKHTIELGSKNKEGLYILSITSGGKELRELIELRYK